MKKQSADFSFLCNRIYTYLSVLKIPESKDDERKKQFFENKRRKTKQIYPKNLGIKKEIYRHH